MFSLPQDFFIHFPIEDYAQRPQNDGLPYANHVLFCVNPRLDKEVLVPLVALIIPTNNSTAMHNMPQSLIDLSLCYAIKYFITLHKNNHIWSNCLCRMRK